MRSSFLTLLFLAWTFCVQGAVFSDFYIDPNAASGCTNINSGSTATGTHVYKSIATTAGGGWNSATGVFTPDDGTTPASTVTAGMFASVITNGINTNAVYIGRITTVAAGPNGAITIDATAKSGTAPTTVSGSVAAITIVVGGTWKGPYTGSPSVTFPFGFVGPNMTNAAGNMVCVNVIAGTNYNVTNAVTASVNGPIRWESYTNTAHDGGRGATISGGTVVAGYTLFTASGNHNDYDGFTFLNNGATLTSDLFAASGAGNMYRRCAFIGSRGSGVNASVVGFFVECEAATNNLSNTANKGGFENVAANHVYLRCVSHDSTNINASGFYCSQAATFIDCISHNVGSNHITFATTGDPNIILNCDFNMARVSGILLNGVPAVSQLIYAENCNFITNGGFAVNGPVGSIYKRNGAFYNLAVGSGSKTNTSGDISANMVSVFTNSFTTYATGVDPWVNPDNGNFRIDLAASWGVGRDSYLFTSAGYTNTIGYRDIGAAQHIGITNGVTFFSTQ